MAIAPARTVVALRDGRRTHGASREVDHLRPVIRASSRGSALVCVILVALSFAAGASAQDVTAEDMRSLDERVQSIKSDVLEIAAELTQLEEKLLYPSSTQVAVFVSLSEGYEGDIDSVEIQIDGEAVAHHIYTYEEVDALGKGGVQRVYTGNLRTGDHQLVVAVKGTLASGREVAEQQSFTISKRRRPSSSACASPQAIRAS